MPADSLITDPRHVVLAVLGIVVSPPVRTGV